jgi:hypothetical protein
MKMYAQCKFCDGLVFFTLPEKPDPELVTVVFKAAMDKHLLEHVEEITEIPYESKH